MFRNNDHGRHRSWQAHIVYRGAGKGAGLWGMFSTVLDLTYLMYLRCKQMMFPSSVRYLVHLGAS